MMCQMWISRVFLYIMNCTLFVWETSFQGWIWGFFVCVCTQNANLLLDPVEFYFSGAKLFCTLKAPWIKGTELLKGGSLFVLL